MKAAALAGKGAGAPPPQLWKWQLASRPTWRELDALDFRELATAIMLHNVYETVRAWKSGKASPEERKQYAELVKAGVVGVKVK